MTSNNVDDLFQSAVDDGILSTDAMSSIGNIDDYGAQIQAGMGVDIDDVQSSEVVLVGLLIDDSSSIRFEGNTQVVRDGVNVVFSALGDSKQNDSILVHSRFLNSGILDPCIPLTKATKLDNSNYNPGGYTPLYDETAVFLATMLAKAQQFLDNGIACRTVTLIATDGADQGSHRQTPKSIRPIIKDMLKQECHIVAAMGIDDGGYTDFKSVFQEMGIDDQWILTPQNNEGEIRKAFEVFSQSAVRASQGGASFSKTAIGGFGS